MFRFKWISRLLFSRLLLPYGMAVALFLPLTSIADTQAIQQLELFNKKIGVQPKALGKPASPTALKRKKALRKASDAQNSDDVAPSDETVTSDEDAINKQAFEDVKRKLFPLTSDQILNLHRTQQANEFAIQSPAATPPRPAVSTQIVKLDPGSTPSVVRVSQGFISSVVFLDSTGAPWPIVAYDLGDPTSFNIQWDKTGGNTLMIQSKKLYSYGNMAIKLQGMNTPVMLTLIPGQQVIDYRVDMRVMGFGPNAKQLTTGLELPSTENNVLLPLLDDVKPTSAKPLRVMGGPAEAWIDGNIMYLRSRLTLLSPGWLSMMTSADGMNAYKLMKAPVLLVSWHGRVMQLKVEGLNHG